MKGLSWKGVAQQPIRLPDNVFGCEAKKIFIFNGRSASAAHFEFSSKINEQIPSGRRVIIASLHCSSVDSKQ